MLFEKKRKFNHATTGQNRDSYPTREELARLLRLYGLTRGGCIIEPHDGGGYRVHVVHPADLEAIRGKEGAI